MGKNDFIFYLFRYAAMTGNLVFCLWILYNGINEGFRGTIYEIVSYISLLLLLLLNATLLYWAGKKQAALNEYILVLTTVKNIIMQAKIFRNKWLTIAGLLLVMPAAFFIIVSILKYGPGISAPFEWVAPELEKWGINESLGRNINLLIVIGPVLAIIFTIFQVLKIEWHVNKEEVLLHFTVQKKRVPLLVAVCSAGLLLVLFFYLFSENCNC